MMSCKSVMNPLRIIALVLVLSLCLNLLPSGRIAAAEGVDMKSEIAAETGWNIDDLKPINLSAEKDGIRFEVISGLVREDGAAFLCSLEDLERKYEGSAFDPSFSDSFVTSGDYAEFHYPDSPHHKTTYFISKATSSLEKADTTVTLTACPIRIVHEPDFLIDLTPYLKQYGETTEGATPPGKLLKLDTPVFLDSQADIKVLDYTRSLDIPLIDNVFLSNIGWIDGQLHVQLHTTLPGCFTKDGVMYCSWSSWVFGNASLDEASRFSWDDNNDNWPEWSEFIFDCTPDQADKLELYAEVSTLDDVLPEGLEVTFPLSAVWAE